MSVKVHPGHGNGRTFFGVFTVVVLVDIASSGYYLVIFVTVNYNYTELSRFLDM